MHKQATPERVSMTEMITSDSNWNQYSCFHDSFLEILSYENQKFYNADVWQLHYV